MDIRREHFTEQANYEKPFSSGIPTNALNVG